MSAQTGVTIQGLGLVQQFRAPGIRLINTTLKAMSIIAKVPEDQRSATQRRRAERFKEFGCATCHKLAPGKIGLTEVGAKLAHLHLGCVEVEKLLAGGTAPSIDRVQSGRHNAR